MDAAIRLVAADVGVGTEMRGDLAGVFVYKFKMNAQETLLAYSMQPTKQKPTELVLLAVGAHETFYTQLKR